MNKERLKFRIPALLLWGLTLAGYVLQIIWIVFRFRDSGSAFNPLWLFILLYVTVLVFVIDMATSDIFNKVAWIIMAGVMPYITFPVYLIQKKRLLRIQRRKNDFLNKVCQRLLIKETESL